MSPVRPLPDAAILALHRHRLSLIVLGQVLAKRLGLVNKLLDNPAEPNPFDIMDADSERERMLLAAATRRACTTANELPDTLPRTALSPPLEREPTEEAPLPELCKHRHPVTGHICERPKHDDDVHQVQQADGIRTWGST
jgi:hypothetical protein